jgi:hypothetical protein
MDYEMTEQEEQENLDMAQALNEIAAIVDASESDPEVMQRMLVQIYRIVARFA